MLSIPILSGEDVVAVLSVGSEQRRAFDRGQVITLETLADGVGIILRNAELYQAVERTNARLVELDRMKSELVNIVAHDFRAPLAGVLGHAELLEWKPDDPRERRVEQARAIIQSATHMANLVDKTLKTTRLETGHFPFEFGLVDLAATLRAVVARFPRSSSHALRLRALRGAGAGVGRPRPHGGGAGQPDLERDQVLAGGRRGRGRCSSAGTTPPP